MRVVVNVSYRQLNRGRECSDAVARILRETGLEPQRLELDVTEEAFLREGSTAVRTLRTLHDLGIRISVDDFGSGFASLIRLKNFPFANVKIARQRGTSGGIEPQSTSESVVCTLKCEAVVCRSAWNNSSGYVLP